MIGNNEICVNDICNGELNKRKYISTCLRELDLRKYEPRDNVRPGCRNLVVDIDVGNILSDAYDRGEHMSIAMDNVETYLDSLDNVCEIEDELSECEEDSWEFDQESGDINAAAVILAVAVIGGTICGMKKLVNHIKARKRSKQVENAPNTNEEENTIEEEDSND